MSTKGISTFSLLLNGMSVSPPLIATQRTTLEGTLENVQSQLRHREVRQWKREELEIDFFFSRTLVSE